MMRQKTSRPAWPSVATNLYGLTRDDAVLISHFQIGKLTKTIVGRWKVQVDSSWRQTPYEMRRMLYEQLDEAFTPSNPGCSIQNTAENLYIYDNIDDENCRYSTT